MLLGYNKVTIYRKCVFHIQHTRNVWGCLNYMELGRSQCEIMGASFIDDFVKNMSALPYHKARPPYEGTKQTGRGQSK